MRNPGAPLNSGNLPANDGVYPLTYVPTAYEKPSPAYYPGPSEAYMQPMRIYSAFYNYQDIPFQKLRTDYKS